MNIKNCVILNVFLNIFFKKQGIILRLFWTEGLTKSVQKSLYFEPYLRLKKLTGIGGMTSSSSHQFLRLNKSSTCSRLTELG